MAAAANGNPLQEESFGTQSYQVRIELFGSNSTLVPVATFESPPPASIVGAGEYYPTVVATLPGLLALPSRVFGLTQIDRTGAPAGGEAAQLQDWFDGE